MIMSLDWSEIINASVDTFNMVFISTVFAGLIGVPLGVFLFSLSSKKILNNRMLYNILAFIVNILRSIPFIILLVIMLPFTNVIVGTTIGVVGVIPPLVVAAFPFVARLVESSLEDLDSGLIDMGLAIGASNWQIIWHILLVEIRPRIVSNLTVTMVSLVAFSAMAGVVGGGGLGDLAIRYGYQRFDTTILLITVILIIILVQVIQLLGDIYTKFLTHK